MATRKAQIIIEVDDRSLVELNDEIKQLEKSINNLKVGTKEWQAANVKLGDLKTKFQAATNEAKKLQGAVQKISGAEQLRSIAKLGAGLVGTFSAVSGSLKMLGINSEAFDEMTAKATTLMSIMGGLNQVAEMFSAQNLKGLKAVGGGFKTLVTTVKAASTGMKAALISTGIGALVVGVGLLIANFDKIKNLLSGQAKEQKKLNADNYEAAQAATKIAEIRYQQTLKENELAKEQFAARMKENERLNLTMHARDKIEIDNQFLAEAALQLAKDRVTENDEYLKTLRDEKKEAKEKDKAAIQAKINIAIATQGLLAQEELLAEELKRQADIMYTISDQLQTNRDRTEEINNELIKLNGLVDKEYSIYKRNLELLDMQISDLEEMSKIMDGLKEDEEIKLNTLKAQRAALIQQEEERRKQLKITLEALNYERELQNLYARTAQFYLQINTAILERQYATEENIKGLEDEIEIIKNEYELYKDLAEEKANIANFDKKGLELYYKQNEEQLKIVNKYKELTGLFRDQIKIAVDKQNIDKIDRGLYAEKLDAGAKELFNLYQIKEATIAKLNNEKIILGLKKQALDYEENQLEVNEQIVQNQLDYYQAQLTTAQEALANVKKGAIYDNERKTALEKVMELEGKINELTTESATNKQAIVEKNNEISIANEEILITEEKINAATQEQLDKAKAVTDELEKQAEFHERANDFLNQYAEEINAVRDVIANSLEFLATLQDRKAADAQERIDELNEDLEELNEAEDDRMSKLDDYNELLKDANGERYDELLRLIAQEEAANIAAQENEQTKRDEINAEIEAQEAKKAEAEFKAARWRKAQALVDAIIQGALGVIKALPNVFLAVATGVAAAAGIATIAAQPLPPKDFDEGGFTPKSASNKTPVGIVHANEYVAPAFVTQSPEAQAHIAALEAQRLRGYAEGGMVMPATSTSGSDYIDYERLGAVILQGMKTMPNPVVSVQKITAVQREVKVTKQLAGL